VWVVPKLERKLNELWSRKIHEVAIFTSRIVGGDPYTTLKLDGPANTADSTWTPRFMAETLMHVMMMAAKKFAVRGNVKFTLRLFTIESIGSRVQIAQITIKIDETMIASYFSETQAAPADDDSPPRLSLNAAPKEPKAAIDEAGDEEVEDEAEYEEEYEDEEYEDEEADEGDGDEEEPEEEGEYEDEEGAEDEPDEEEDPPPKKRPRKAPAKKPAAKRKAGREANSDPRTAVYEPQPWFGLPREGQWDGRGAEEERPRLRRPLMADGADAGPGWGRRPPGRGPDEEPRFRPRFRRDEGDEEPAPGFRARLRRDADEGDEDPLSPLLRQRRREFEGRDRRPEASPVNSDQMVVMMMAQMSQAQAQTQAAMMQMTSQMASVLGNETRLHLEMMRKDFDRQTKQVERSFDKMYEVITAQMFQFDENRKADSMGWQALQRAINMMVQTRERESNYASQIAALEARLETKEKAQRSESRANIMRNLQQVARVMWTEFKRAKRPGDPPSDDDPMSMFQDENDPPPGGGGGNGTGGAAAPAGGLPKAPRTPNPLYPGMVPMTVPEGDSELPEDLAMICKRQQVYFPGPEAFQKAPLTTMCQFLATTVLPDQLRKIKATVNHTDWSALDEILRAQDEDTVRTALFTLTLSMSGTDRWEALQKVLYPCQLKVLDDLGLLLQGETPKIQPGS